MNALRYITLNYLNSKIIYNITRPCRVAEGDGERDAGKSQHRENASEGKYLSEG